MTLYSNRTVNKTVAQGDLSLLSEEKKPATDRDFGRLSNNITSHLFFLSGEEAEDDNKGRDHPMPGKYYMDDIHLDFSLLWICLEISPKL